MTTVDLRDMGPDDARASVDRVKAHVAAGWTDLIAQWRGRAWIALGYASWDALCDAEYGVRMALPRDERREAVAELRSEGMSTRAIGSALGVHHSTVAEDVATVGNPTDRVTSLDGRERPATQPARPAPAPAPVVTLPPAPVAEPAAAPAAVEATVAYSMSDPSIRVLTIRRDFVRWLMRVHPFDIDPEEMAVLIEDEDFEWSRLARRQADLNDYFSRLLAARPRGLRLIGEQR